MMPLRKEKAEVTEEEAGAKEKTMQTHQKSHLMDAKHVQVVSWTSEAKNREEGHGACRAVERVWDRVFWELGIKFPCDTMQ